MRTPLDSTFRSIIIVGSAAHGALNLNQLDVPSSRAKSVYIANEQRGSFQRVYTPMRRQLATLLTGLQDDQLNQFDLILFLDPVPDESLMQITPNTAVASQHG